MGGRDDLIGHSNDSKKKQRKKVSASQISLSLPLNEGLTVQGTLRTMVTWLVNPDMIPDVM